MRPWAHGAQPCWRQRLRRSARPPVGRSWLSPPTLPRSLTPSLAYPPRRGGQRRKRFGWKTPRHRCPTTVRVCARRSSPSCCAVGAASAQASLDVLLAPLLARYKLPALAAAVVKHGTIVAVGATSLLERPVTSSKELQRP